MTIEVPELARRRYLDACIAGDYPAALLVCQALRQSGLTWSALVRSLLSPALWRVGDLWMYGKVTVAQEQRVTAITEAVIQTLLSDSPTPRANARVLLTGPEGEWHVLPSRMVALVLRQLGWDVLQLTPAIPPEDLLTLARTEHGHVAGISCSLPGNLVPAWQSITALRQAGVRVLAGGRAFVAYPGLAQSLGADAGAHDLLQAHEVLLEWVTQPAPGPRPPTLQRRWEGLESTWAATERIVADAGVLAVDIEGVALAGEVLRQDLTLMLTTAVAAALAQRAAILADHFAWYEDLLSVGGVDPGSAPALLRALSRVLPADADDIRDVIAEVVSRPRARQSPA